MLPLGAPLHRESEILIRASNHDHQMWTATWRKGERQPVATSMRQALFGPESAAVAPKYGSYRPRKTSPGPDKAVDLGALGGTRTLAF